MAECDDNGTPLDCPDDSGYVPSYTIDDEIDESTLSSTSSDADETTNPGCEVENGAIVCDLRKLSEICNTVGLSPDMISGVLVQMLAQHFSCPEDIIIPELRGYVYDPDPAETRIWIQPLYTWNKTDAGKVPRIVYVDLDQQSKRITIGDQFYQHNTRLGAQGFVRSWSGSHRFMCIGHTDLEASLLARELAQFWTQFTPWIIANLPFHDFHVQSRSAPQQFDELGDRMGVALVVSYSYIWSWELVPDGPPLKAVTMTKDN